jgi:hypothetical protein
MLVFGYTLANALDNQGAYDRQIGTALVYDAESLRGTHEIANSHVLGYLELGPMSKKAVEKYPILDEILRTFFEGGDWSATYLRSLGFDTQYQQILTPTAEKAVCDGAPDRVSGRYRLYVVEKTLIIRFNNAKPSCGPS